LKYVYQYKDHLGNIRLSYSDNVLKNGTIAQNEIIEENNYYPFGSWVKLAVIIYVRFNTLIINLLSLNTNLPFSILGMFCVFKIS